MWATSYDRVHAHLSGVAGGLANKNSLRVHMTKFTVILITSILKLKEREKKMESLFGNRKFSLKALTDFSDM